MPTLVARGSITIIDVMDGANGSAVAVQPSRALSFTATDGTLDPSQAAITFTASTSGLSNPTFVWTFSGFETAPTSSGTATQVVTAAQFGTSKSATVTCTVNGSFSETATIVRLEKSTAAAGATVGAPTGTNVGGVAAETVATKANGALQKAGDAITGRINLEVADGLFAGTDLDNGVYLGSNGLVGKKAGKTTIALGTDGALRMSGQLMLGSFTGYSWPAAGQKGAYLGPEGLMLGNSNDGKYFQVTDAGNLYAPGLKIENGVVTLSQANVVNTLNLAGNSVTVPVGVDWTGSVYGSNGTIVSTPSSDFGGGQVSVTCTAIFSVGNFTRVNYGDPPGFFTVYLRLFRNNVVIKEVELGAWQPGDLRISNTMVHLDSPGEGTHSYQFGLRTNYTLGGNDHCRVYRVTAAFLGAKR